MQPRGGRGHLAVSLHGVGGLVCKVSETQMMLDGCHCKCHCVPLLGMRPPCSPPWSCEFFLPYFLTLQQEF